MSDINIHLAQRPHWASRELWAQLTYVRAALAALKEAMLSTQEAIRAAEPGSAQREVQHLNHETLRQQSQGLKRVHRELVAYGPTQSMRRRSDGWRRRGCPGLQRIPMPGQVDLVDRGDAPQ